MAISKEKELREREETASAQLESSKNPDDLYETIVEAAAEQASALEGLVGATGSPTEKASDANIYATESVVYDSYSKYSGVVENEVRASKLTDTEALIEKGTATYQASQRAGEDEEE